MTEEKRERNDYGMALLSRRVHEREDVLLGEIVRFLARADKAAFARMYALVKTEEAAMDARMNELLGNFRGGTKETDTETEQKPARPSGGAHQREE